jgi:hypothetical protein
MTSERIAELRALKIEINRPDGDFSGIDLKAIGTCRAALSEALDAIERVGRLLDWHYHNRGTDLISSADVFCALSGERPLYERNMSEGLRAALEGKGDIIASRAAASGSLIDIDSDEEIEPLKIADMWGPWKGPK